jgi:hypothetical protein
MRKHCTVCDGRLGMWERMWGRFDHPTCRSGSTAKHPAPPGPSTDSIVPERTAVPGKGMGIAFSDLAVLPGTEEKEISAL